MRPLTYNSSHRLAAGAFFSVKKQPFFRFSCFSCVVSIVVTFCLFLTDLELYQKNQHPEQASENRLEKWVWTVKLSLCLTTTFEVWGLKCSEINKITPSHTTTFYHINLALALLGSAERLTTPQITSPGNQIQVQDTKVQVQDIKYKSRTQNTSPGPRPTSPTPWNFMLLTLKPDLQHPRPDFRT